MKRSKPWVDKGKSRISGVCIGRCLRQAIEAYIHHRQQNNARQVEELKQALSIEMEEREVFINRQDRKEILDIHEKHWMKYYCRFPS